MRCNKSPAPCLSCPAEDVLLSVRCPRLPLRSEAASVRLDPLSRSTTAPAPAFTAALQRRPRAPRLQSSSSPQRSLAGRPSKARKRKRKGGRDPLYNSAKDIRRLQLAKKDRLDKAQLHLKAEQPQPQEGLHPDSDDSAEPPSPPPPAQPPGTAVVLSPSSSAAAVAAGHPPSQSSPPAYQAAPPSSAAPPPPSPSVGLPSSQPFAPSSLQWLADFQHRLASVQLLGSSLPQVVATEVAAAVATVTAQRRVDELRWREEVSAQQAKCQEAEAALADLRRRLDDTEREHKAELRRRAPAQRTAVRYLNLIQRYNALVKEVEALKALHPPPADESLDLTLKN